MLLTMNNMRQLSHDDCNAVFARLPLQLKRRFLHLLTDIAVETTTQPDWAAVLLWARHVYKKIPAAPARKSCDTPKRNEKSKHPHR